jgi:hypothetical protein
MEETEEEEEGGFPVHIVTEEEKLRWMEELLVEENLNQEDLNPLPVNNKEEEELFFVVHSGHHTDRIEEEEFCDKDDFPVFHRVSTKKQTKPHPTRRTQPTQPTKPRQTYKKPTTQTKPSQPKQLYKPTTQPTKPSLKQTHRPLTQKRTLKQRQTQQQRPRWR